MLGNTSAEAVSVDLTGLTVGGTTAEELVLLGNFIPEKTAERAGTVVTLPAYSILILGRRIRRAKQNTGTKTGLWANPTDLYAFLQNLQIRLPVTASRSSNPEYHHSERFFQKLYLIRSFTPSAVIVIPKLCSSCADVQQQLFTVPVTNVIDQTLIQLDGIEMHDIQRRQRRITASEIIQK